MDENSIFSSLITINTCAITLMITIIMIRKLYLIEKITDLKVSEKELKNTINMELQPFGEIETAPEFTEELDQELSIIKSKHQSREKIQNLNSTIEKLTYILICPSIRIKIEKSLSNIEKIQTEIFILKKSLDYFIEMKNHKTSEILKEYNNAIKIDEKRSEKIINYKKLKDKISFIEGMIKNENFQKLNYLILYQFVIGICAPLLSINILTYGVTTIHILSNTYDQSIFIGLTLCSLSMFPYACIIGYQISRNIFRHTTDTPST